VIEEELGAICHRLWSRLGNCTMFAEIINERPKGAFADDVKLYFVVKIKKGTPSSFDGVPFFSSEQLLNDSDIYGRGTFLPLLYFKGHPVAFSERLEAFPTDS
jgi:hypothetical protein